ncbi:unnamed protein product, partial [Cyprideis torosa]
MKDAYSFDVSDAMAEKSYRLMYDAYMRIFKRCGLDFRVVEADSGAIGGNFSHEFMVLAKTGEDTIVVCSECEYSSNIEKARVVRPPAGPEGEALAMERVKTPGKKTVAAVCDYLDISPRNLVKTMVYIADGKPVAVLVRGDHEVEEVKLKNHLGVSVLERASDKELYDAFGGPPGSVGPVGVDIKLVCDHTVPTMINFVTGGNEKDVHVVNVNFGRNFQVESQADLRKITETDPCPQCGGRVELTEGIEVGHIFKLGTKYSEAMNAVFQDDTGNENLFFMGCYGI